MRIFLLILALMILSAQTYAQEVKPDSDITVIFGSYCCGVDHGTAEKINAYLQASDKVSNVTRSDAWGYEGEYDMYITLKNKDDVKGVYDDLRNLIPAVGERAPVSIGGPGLEEFRTSPPKGS